MVNPSVRDYLRANRERHLGELFDLLRFPSVANETHDPDPCRQCAEWLRDRAAGLGFDAGIVETPGKPSLIAHLNVSDDAPTLLVYGHYDVQPAEPLELWESPPFEPEIRDGAIYARGANDDKGQLYAHLMAIEALRETDGVPVNVAMLIEGEEEIGSPNLEPLVRRRADELRADAAVISDCEWYDERMPSITSGLRGLAYLELTVTGPAADLHSGIHGGAVRNPVNALAKLVGGLHDADGRVTIPGFYDDVLPLSDEEREQWRELDFDADAYAASLGVPVLDGGERGLDVLERRWARPTLDCNGIVGGYTAPGSKTIIPSRASAKISMRLVPDQDPDRIVESFRRYVADRAPAGVSTRIEVHAGGRPVLLNREFPEMQAGRDALAEAFGRPATFVRTGASVPVTELIQRLLGLDAVMMGFGLPDDNLHSPNERFRLSQLDGGAVAAATFMQKLAECARR